MSRSPRTIAADEPEATPRADGRRYALASLAGALAPTAIFAWVAFKSEAKLRARLQPGGIELGRFFDAQARSLAHGYWDVPRAIAGYEGWIVGGKAYIYFGPTPALLRMPILAVTDRFDGRLTAWSMTLAFVVALVGVARILWAQRAVLRGSAPVSRWECWVVAAWIFTVGAGSALMFQAGVAWVYDEAMLWGVALALVGFDAVIGVVRSSTPRRIVYASAVATFAILARPTVGIGPTAAIFLLALGLGVHAVRHRDGPGGRGVVATVVGASWRLVVAGAVPLVAFVGVQYAKFGALDVPYSSWVAAGKLPILHSVIEHNNGSFFNVRIVPTSILAYVRPDSLELLSKWPFIGLPTHNTPGLLGVRVIGATASIPSTMPLLTLLAIVGAVLLVRGVLRGEASGVLVPAVVGAVLAVGPGLAFAGFATRYLGDFVPALVLLAGLAVCRVAELPEAGWTAARRAWVVGLAALAVLSVIVTLAITADAYSPRRFTVSAALGEGRCPCVSE